MGRRGRDRGLDVGRASALLYWRLAFLAYAAFVSFLLLTPHPLADLGLGGYSETLTTGRGQHLMLFTGLAFLGLACRWPVSRAVLTLLLAGYALGTEELQAIIPPRTPEWADVAENLLGIALGFALFASLARVAARRTTAT